MKQTPVEWLLTYLPQIDYGNDPYYRDIIEQAKEMEKQQLEKTYNNAWMLGQDHIEIDFKDYYNKTFNK